jgi:glycosyltransferase involved in cell wall biosynthesis
MQERRPSQQGARIGVVGTYPPRPCGLATFTADVVEALGAHGHHVEVAALVDYAAEPAGLADHVLLRHDPTSSHALAERLSVNVDVVLIQHEFGIFGGADGILLGELTGALRVPYALTLHTVIGQFTATQRAALTQPLAGAAAVLVFSEDAAGLLADAFPGVEARCHVVPHGAPCQLYQPAVAGDRRRLGLPETAAVISTFGLLSPGKGIEHAIDAIAGLRHAVDDIVYVIAGRTHPDIVRTHGEHYRETLSELARRRRVDDIVMFRDWFHDIDDLAALLGETTVFVTPYLDAEQIVSGALSYAVAAGVPFVSTPYRYATELAEHGCGLLVPFADPDGLAAALKELLTDPTRRAQLAAGARRVGASMSWPAVARSTAAILADLT